MKLNRVRRRCRDLVKTDRLIKLPDDVLLNILERVGTLDAIRACVASKRAQNLPAMLSQIVIVPSARELHRDNRVVVKVINKILATRSPHIPIHKLKLRFIMRGDDHLLIGRSVALAMASQDIHGAEFEVLTRDKFTFGYHAPPNPLDFAKQFNGFIGECPDAFAGLTRLHLQNLRFGDGSHIANILATCKRLESLSFFACDAGIASVLHVEHARLVELDIDSGKFSRVELNCLPKLQRISYSNWPYANYPLVLGFVPQLSNITLSCTYNLDIPIRLSQLLVNGPSISTLHLDFRSEKIWIQPECQKLLAPLLGKLRLVNLDNLPEERDIDWTMFFLEAAPSLHELCITVWNHKCQCKSQKSYYAKTDVKWEPSVADFKHRSLAHLTIHGFESDDNFTRYVVRVLKVAVNIKEVYLHDRKLCKLCRNISDLEIRPSRYPQTIDEEDSLRKKITEEVTASPAVIHFRPSCNYSPPESM